MSARALSRCGALALFVVVAAGVRPGLLPFVLAALALGWWARGSAGSQNIERVER